jgi:hypothetical protein
VESENEFPKDGNENEGPKNDNYEVGYKKPPKSGQFPKGTSGNPKGRPKGSKNLASIVLQESRKKVQMKGPGGPRKVTKLQATVIQMVNQSAQGESRARREYIPLVERAEEAINAESAPLAVQELDQRVMESLRRRMQKMKTEAAGSNGGEEEA